MAQLNSQKIILTLERHKDDLKRFSVVKIGLFGSFAQKKASAGSDIDFLVEFDEPSFDKYMDCKFFLEKLFSRKVDLVVEHALKPALEYVKEDTVYAQIS